MIREHFPWGRDWPPRRKVVNLADESFHVKYPPTDPLKPTSFVDAWIAGYDDGYATTSPVDAFPPNQYGLYDMGGNVFQWCEDWWSEEQKDRVQRGFAWSREDREGALSSSRGYRVPKYSDPNGGFRCVLGPASAPSPPLGGGEPASGSPRL